MSFWDKAKKTLEDAASTMNKEAKSLGKQYELGQLETERDREFTELGKVAFKLYQQRAISDTEIKVVAKRIMELNERIAEKREEIESVKAEEKQQEQEDE
ncbi:MAG: hypothetical protein R6V19_05345 [Armatimonadota bacterium]